MAYSILKHIQYNLWANSRIIEMLKPLDEKLIFTQLKSSFPGIAKTLLHIWDAETIWLKRLQGESLNQLPSKEFHGNKNELLIGLQKSSEAIISFIGSKGDDFISSTISYKTTRGDAYENVAEDILFHLVNHGTYHRGQIITMLRELEIVHVPNTDLINYLRTAK